MNYFLRICLSIIFLYGTHGFGMELMPIPEKVVQKEGLFRVTEGFTAGLETPNSRAYRAVRRMLNRLGGRTGIFFKDNKIKNGAEGDVALSVGYKRIGALRLGEDESYRLSVTAGGIRLSAETDIGVLRGLETLLQLLSANKEGYYFPAVEIEDEPRFPWRGLLIDSCRHFFPVGVIKRNIDGMAAVKLNVLHWHLTEDQGFRVESRVFPKLHQMGSDGLYYTQAQIGDVIAYAADRGIRVMPEFDIPGHSTSWLVGYPELGSASGPYEIERKYGVKDPTFNPTKKATYKFFKKFFKEMAQLFPDDYVHIGGDENNGKHWDANREIQAYMKKHNLKDNHQLQAHFNGKILKILTKLNKKMVGWDEIYQPELPTTIVIQSWRGKEALRDSAKKGYSGILSNGYYIDLAQPTDFHYLNDPIPEDSGLSEAEKKRILGGEATMWAELISQETIDSRIWPRTAAIAERFWSKSSVRDVEEMYRRLEVIGVQLEELGLTHIKNRDMMFRRLTGGRDIGPLKVLVGVVEPLKLYNRHRQGVTYTFYSPLTRVVDAAWPDARRARVFRKRVEDFIQSPTPETGQELKKDLQCWHANHAKLKPIIDVSPVLKEIEPLSENLSQIAAIGIEAIDAILTQQPKDTQWHEASSETLQKAKKPAGHAELMIVASIEKLTKR